MLLKELFTILPYDEDIKIFKSVDTDNTENGIKWQEIACFDNSEELENMITEKYGEWIVFNTYNNYGGHIISIYPISFGDMISKFDNKDSSIIHKNLLERN